MPLPSPNDGEDRDAFVGRCMGDETMKGDFPEQDQRVAVCMSQWRRAKGEPEPDEAEKGDYMPMHDDDTEDEKPEKALPGAHEYKAFPSFAVKVVDEARGVVDSIVAVMGNIDLGADVIQPGAFVKTIAERGPRVKVLDLHKTDSVRRIIGKPLAMKELKRHELPAELLERYPEASGGLWARTQFALETEAGKDAFELIKGGFLNEWSIGYDPKKADAGTAQVQGRKVAVRNLREVALLEYSPVIFGMNPATMTLSAKMAAAQAERDASKREAAIGSAALPASTAPIKEMTDSGPCQRLGDVLQGSIHKVFTNLADEWYIQGLLNRDERIELSGLIGDALDLLTEGIPEAVAQRKVYFGGAPMMMAAPPPSQQASRPAPHTTEPAPATTRSMSPDAPLTPARSGAEPDDQMADLKRLLADVDLSLAELDALILEE